MGLYAQRTPLHFPSPSHQQMTLPCAVIVIA